jgi:hypothetical protein
MQWAAQCRAEAQTKEEQQRLAYHRSRRQELKGLKFRARLHAAPCRMEGQRATEGKTGFAVEYCPPRKQHAA